jgi:hypothetical protein
MGVVSGVAKFTVTRWEQISRYKRIVVNTNTILFYRKVFVKEAKAAYVAI